MTVTYMFRAKNRPAQGQAPENNADTQGAPLFDAPPAFVGRDQLRPPQAATQQDSETIAGHLSGDAPFWPAASSSAAPEPPARPGAATGPTSSRLPSRYVEAAGRIILVAKARGGIGATTLAVNLALELQLRAAKRNGAVGGRVALVDLDIQLGNAGSFLDLADRGGMLALARLGAEPDGQAVRHAMVRHPSGLNVLVAPTTAIPFEAFDAWRIAAILDALAAEHDVVIVDLPPALIGWLEPVLARAERLLMVTDLAVPSIARARRIMCLMTEDRPDMPVEIVVAHEKKPFRLGQTHRDAARALGHGLRHWLPDEPKLARLALDRGEPLVQLAPRCGWCKAVRAIATDLEVPAGTGIDTTTRGGN